MVATRSVKGQRGDTYVGFSAAWNTVQEDGGQDLLHAGEASDSAESLSSISLQEAIVATCLLGQSADLAAHRNAMAGGNISRQYFEDAMKGIKSNYSKLIVQALSESNGAAKEPVQDAEVKEQARG